MKFYGKTDIGKLRHSNQDDFAIVELPDGAVFALVCDGMGGANAGNVASRKACETVTGFFERSYRKGLEPDGIAALIQSAVLSANIEVYEMAGADPELSGMGTTAVAAYVSENTAVISHVGDSRAYLIDGEANQLTRDHSVVQSLVESGKLTADEARVHPRRNVITRALGIEPDVLVDTAEYKLKSGDIILLCSDGLSNFVSPDDMKDAFSGAAVEDAVGLLIDRANANGGADNITAVAVAV